MMRSLFGGRRRSVFGTGRELGDYRTQLHERTEQIDARLSDVADDIDALRRRDLDPDETVERLSAHEEALRGTTPNRSTLERDPTRTPCLTDVFVKACT